MVDDEAESLAYVGLAIYALLKQIAISKNKLSGNCEASQTLDLIINESDRFKIWSCSAGLLVPGHGSLDYRVREAESLSKTFRSFLTDLRENFEEVLTLGLQETPVVRTEVGAAEDDSEDDDDGDNSDILGTLLESIKDIIDRLFRLATKLRSPDTGLRSSRAQNFQLLDDGVDLLKCFSEFDHDFVSSLFRYYRKGPKLANGAECTASPSGNSKVYIDDGASRYWIERIALANVARRRQFAYWKHHYLKLEKHTEAASAARKVPELTKVTAKLAPVNPTIAMTTLTAIRLPNPTQGFGDLASNVSVSEYMPLSAGEHNDVVTFPPPPHVAADSKFFECPYCFTTCAKKTSEVEAWQSVNQLYGNKADWVQHEASHATTWRCPVHPKEVFDNLVAFRLHATDGHVQNALIKGSIHEIVVAESVYKTRRSCPVCTVSDLSAAQLDNHVAAHLERLAIFSLPKHAGMVEADDDGQDSNEAKAEEDLRGLDMESGFRFDSAPAAMLDEKSSSDTSSRTSRGSVDTRVLVTGTDWTSKATSYSAVYNPPIRQRIAYQVTQHVTSRNHLDSMQRPAVRGSSRPTQAKASGPAIQQVARGQADEAPDEYPLKRNEREVRSESSYADEEYPFTTLRSRTCRLFVQIPPDELGQRLDFLEDNQRILDKEVVDSIQDQIFDQAVDFSRMSKLVPMMSCVYCLALIQVSKTRRSERLPALFQRLRTPSSEEKQDYNDKVTSVLKAIQDMKSTRRDASIPQSQKPAQRERGGQVHVDPRAGTRVQDAKQLPLRGRVVSHQQQMLEAADDVDTLDLTAIFEGRLTNENNIAAAEVKDLDSSPLEDVRLLSSKYKEQNSPRTFFRPGRVFAILWHEGVGESSSKKATDALMEPKPSDKFNSGTTVARGRYNEPVFGHIQRMVVINTRRASCWCVSIGTYGGRGLTKKGLLKDEINAHAIIYDVERGVQSLKNEPSTKQRPIGVKMAEGESLDIASRVHLGKPYIVETNLKVMNVGQVVPKDLEYLLTAIKIELGLA